ncbi:MAG: hypothetical protein WAT67_03980 [Candidatus Contendobacter sp.]
MLYFILGICCALAIYFYALSLAKKHQTEYINQYQPPQRVMEKVQSTYPHLNQSDMDLVIAGLKEYFLLCHSAKRRMIAMPSQVVDVAWHEFILFTREYTQFCKKAFGKYLHHTPAEAMISATSAQDSIKRAWRLACRREKINPRKPTGVPLLFAIDTLLNIPDGFQYALDCAVRNQSRYCASHIGCGGGCSGGGCGGDSSGDGGCGGGCGGGGD